MKAIHLCILAAACWSWGCDYEPLTIDEPVDAGHAQDARAALPMFVAPPPVVSETETFAPINPGTTPNCSSGSHANPNLGGTAACNCTRRPGPNRSSQCPIGVGQSVSATIGSEGGTIQLLGEQGKAAGIAMSLTIPPSALSAPTTITITETSEVLPKGFVDLSPVYRMSPSDLRFALPVAVRMPMGNGTGTYGSDVALYWTTDNGDGFERVGDSSLNAGFMQGTTFRLGTAFTGVPVCSVSPQCRP